MQTLVVVTLYVLMYNKKMHWCLESISACLTQFDDAYFLQVLPGDVGDEFDILVSVLH